MTWCNKIRSLLFINKVPVSLLSILIPCIVLYKHSDKHPLYWTWLGYSRSCMEDPSHESFANRWIVYSHFVGLGNLLEVVVHYLLIARMTCLNHQDGFLMVSALVCMVIHWTGPTVNITLSRSHNFTKLLHYVVSQL